MKILLDTYIAIWAALDSKELSNTARAMKSITVPPQDYEIKHMAHPETKCQ